MKLCLFPHQSDDYILENLKKNIKNQEVEIYYTYKEIGFLRRIFRKIHLLKLRKILKFEEYWYGEWKKKDKIKIKEIILFDSVIDFSIIDYIKKKYPGARVIFWYWNPIKNPKDVKLLKDKKIEVWTFDEDDKKKYDLNYNTQFYFNTNYKENKVSIKNKIYFIGANKGRLNKLIKFKSYFDNNKITFKFQVLDKKIQLKDRQIEILKSPIKYSEIIKNIKESEALLEIVQENQKGLTLRTMESLFFNKKLITNNKNIKNYDFYSKNNIYIIEDEANLKIDEFLNLPMEKIPEKIKKKYEFYNWIERF